MKKHIRFLEFTIFILMICIYNIYKVENCSAQWVQTSGPGGGWIRGFGIFGNNMFTGTYGAGVFLSTNYGESWKGVNSGLTDSIVYAFDTISNNLFAGTDGSGVFKSTNN